MEDLHNKDLIDQMKAVLHEYEEPYADGAWEEFSGRRKSVRLANWKWLSVAAMILVAGSVWLLYPGDQIKETTSVAKLGKPVVPEPVVPKYVAPAPEKETALAQTRERVYSKPEGLRSLQDKKESSGAGQLMASLQIERKNKATNLQMMIPVGEPTAMARVAELTRPLMKIDGDSATTPAGTGTTFMDFLVEEQSQNKNQAVAKVKSGSKWDFGFEILPTVSNSAVNVGAGLMTEYKLSEHFSVGSGISLVQLQAGRALTPGVSMLSSRQLQSVEANFRGIDVPLNLVYNINKNLYTSVGVSYFNVIQEDSRNTFVAEREVASMATDPVTGLTANVRSFVSETMEEPNSENMLSGRSYLGFFNFSIGRKQEIFKKYNIFIEPFIKLPVGKLSQQDLQLTNGGMKFKVAF